MKSFRQFATITAVFTLLATAMQSLQAQNVVSPKAYMFGFSASFNDSIVYFTDIQEIDSVWFTQKKKMLAGRSNYSYQLRDFFADKMNLPKRTCVVMAALKRKDLEKKYEKLKKQYTGKKAKPYDVRFLTSDEFKFRSVNMGNQDNKVTQDNKKKKEKPKKEKKKKEKKKEK